MRAITQIIKSKSFSSLLGNGIGALLGLLTFALLARFLDKATFGAWIVFLAVYGIFDTLRIGMVLNALVKNLAQSSNSNEEDSVIGSSLMISAIITGLYLLFNCIAYFICISFDLLAEYHSFFKWFVLISLLTLPHNFSTWLLNAKLEIISMSVIRILNQIVFILYIWFFVKADPTIDQVFIGYGLSNLIPSFLCIVLGWAGIQKLFFYSKEMMSKIFHFGKYSMGTLIGSNLLRSSDTFIISTMLGSGGVATYNVPSRMIEIIEMPLRSFAVTALPQYAKMYADGAKEELKNLFERRTGMIFFLLLPISFFSFLFADWVVLLLGGNNYADSAILLRFFATYMAILPLDKFSGVLLDTINKPEINFIKVVLMLVVNVSADYLGIYLFGNLESVAFASTLTFLSGMLFGYYQLNKHLGLNFRNIIVNGWDEFIHWSFKVLKINGN
ncbi:MAG: oligosaccharide flippase family protein [Bacteroidia bacterium]